ncbi:hypothetical protein M569_13368, partial [Genlisea aurea]
DCNDVSLRQWLDNPKRLVHPLECIHIFSQIVDIVNLAHSEGIVVHNVQPSCFVMSSFNRVSFIESASCSDSGSDDKQSGGDELFDSQLVTNAAAFLQNDVDEGGEDSDNEKKENWFPMKRILIMESNWYTPPEEAPTGASDVYKLGVLLFELFCSFSSLDEKIATMANLRHRVLPPELLLKWPKEASFCLWLLHPDPSCRPKMSEILQSELLNEPRSDIEEREAAIELREKIDEQELLLEFLLLIQRRKQDDSDRLNKTVSLLSSDIEEVTKMQADLMKSVEDHRLLTCSEEDDSRSGSRKRVRHRCDDVDESCEAETSGRQPEESGGGALPARLTSNFRKLESAYFSMRFKAAKSPPKSLARSAGDGIGCIDTFLEGLCRYLTYSRLRVKADLKQGDLLNSSNLVCSIGFDRDGEFFATAGVNKKIKVFEYGSISSGDIHYPVAEMAGKSKLSSLCWNGYIKSQIASSNFEGVVWDVTRSQSFVEMREHEKRVWSVDFSAADPTLLASGSDDGCVKLWNINQANDAVSVSTIRTKANICCVQFQTDSARSVAFGSADHKIYYYDLRNQRLPLYCLAGHGKTVSYVKFLDNATLVSASTDNKVKLWDLSTCASRVVDSPVQTYTGHLNVKNFVGLSVSDGYIATGSETNEVFVYHKAFPMPALSLKFTDANSSDESNPFISSVCWRRRGQSSILVAANSMGHIKLLEM